MTDDAAPATAPAASSEHERVRALAAAVGAFAIRDRKMIAAQQRFEAALARGIPAAAEMRAYVSAVRAHFVPFEREARQQLAYVDRELERLYQRQFNLTAERGVAARRVELVQGVLAAVTELGAP